jgi:nitrogen fixation/metabolism regulation signal transduction histidine kinase
MEMILLSKRIKVVYRVSFNLIKLGILGINIKQLNREFNLVVIRKVHINNRYYYRLRKVPKKLIDKNKGKNRSRNRNKHKNKKIRRIKFVIKLIFNALKKMFQLQEDFKFLYF